MAVKIAERLLQVSSLENDTKYDMVKLNILHFIACDHMLMVQNNSHDPTRNLQTSILSSTWYVLICFAVEEQTMRKAEFLFYRIWQVWSSPPSTRYLLNNKHIQ